MRTRNKNRIWILGLLLLALVLVGCQQAAEEAALPEETTVAPSATAPAVTEAITPAPTEPSAGPTPASIAPASDAMVLGDADAPVTIVEFSDYGCPYCATYSEETWPQIKTDLVDTGRVRYVFKDFPLTSLHPKAPQAHAAARCGGEQGAYWAMHDRLFEEQSAWSGSSDPGAAFETMAAELGLEASSFETCLESGDWEDAVDGDVAEGASLGVRGTPTFFVNGYPLVGARGFEFFEQVVELAEEGTLGDAYRPAQ